MRVKDESKELDIDALARVTELEFELNNIYKKHQLLAGERSSTLRKLKLAKDAAGLRNKFSASIDETKYILISMAQDLSRTPESIVADLASRGKKPAVWAEEILGNKPYGIAEAHKLANKASKAIRQARNNDQLKSAHLKGIVTASTLKSALSNYHKGLSTSEYIKFLESDNADKERRIFELEALAGAKASLDTSSKELKQEQARLMVESGQSKRKVASIMNVSEGTIRNWIKNA